MSTNSLGDEVSLLKRPNRFMSRAITVISGKAGVGKTNICLNLAIFLSKLGYRICVFDADVRLPNINTLLGLKPAYNFKDAIVNGLDINDLIIRDYEGIDIFPGSSGVEEITGIEVDRMRLIRSFSEIAHSDFLLNSDFLLVDTPAGISNTVVSFCLATSEIIVVLTSEHASLTEAYALLKTLYVNGFKGAIWIVVNQCKTSYIAKLVYKRFKSIIAKHIGMDVLPLGLISQDGKVVKAIKQQKPFISLYPKSNASKCIGSIAKRLVANRPDHLKGFDVVKFWKGCIDLLSTPLHTKAYLKAGPEFPERKKEQQAIKEQFLQKDVPESPPKSLSMAGVTSKEADGKGLMAAQEHAKDTSEARLNDSGRQEGRYGYKDSTKLWYRVPLIEHGESGSSIDLEITSPAMIEKVIENISMVSKELQFIRKGLEENGKIRLRVEISEETDGEKPEKKNNSS